MIGYGQLFNSEKEKVLYQRHSPVSPEIQLICCLLHDNTAEIPIYLYISHKNILQYVVRHYIKWNIIYKYVYDAYYCEACI